MLIIDARTGSVERRVARAFGRLKLNHELNESYVPPAAPDRRGPNTFAVVAYNVRALRRRTTS